MSAITTAVQIAKTIKTMQDGFKYLSSKAVYVGIPKQNNKTHATQDGKAITNAELLFIHEYGAPSRNIPPRPVLHLALKQQTLIEHVQQLYRDATVAALSGDYGQVDSNMQMIGMQAVNTVKSEFGSGKLAPNSPITIARKHSSAPLIDTSALMGNISYVVREE